MIAIRAIRIFYKIIIFQVSHQKDAVLSKAVPYTKKDVSDMIIAHIHHIPSGQYAIDTNEYENRA